MQVTQIYDILKKHIPLELCESWDNSGLLVNCNNEVTKILVTLDITTKTIIEAKQKDCQLIVSHHPVLFSKINKISSDDLVFKLCQNNISAICMHTNLDNVINGVNDVLVKKIGLTNVVIDENHIRYGEFEQEYSIKQLAQKLKIDLSANAVRYNNFKKSIKTACVVAGSGASFLSYAKSLNVDCLITGDIKHHEAIDATEMEIGLIGASHYATEQPVVDYLQKLLCENLQNIEIIKSEQSKESIQII